MNKYKEEENEIQDIIIHKDRPFHSLGWAISFIRWGISLETDVSDSFDFLELLELLHE